jgi:hypothetical protein
MMITGNLECQTKLAAIILELYDVMSLQDCGCHIVALTAAEDRAAIADRAQNVLNNWHELHEFDEAAHAQPELVRTLLTMYSDMIASYHEVAAGKDGPSPQWILSLL